MVSGSAVPPLYGYTNTVETLDDEQLQFYREVADGLSKGERVAVHGQVGYVIVYVRDVLAAWQERGFELLHDHLTNLSELYVGEAQVHEHCLTWATDCLLATGKFELFLDRTAPKTATRTKTHRANLRLNVQHHLGLPADPVDIVTALKARTGKFIRANEGHYKDALADVLRDHEAAEGDWFEFLRRGSYSKGEKYAHSLFQGGILAHYPELSFHLEAFYANHHAVETIERLTRQAENQVREQLRIPLIGEGWVSETALFRAVERAFPETHVIHHGQPAWLGRQHLDIWIPNWRVAIEYQGKQHFEPVEFFGGRVALEATIERDRRKATLCRQHGVKLLLVTEDVSQETVVALIREHARSLRAGFEAPVNLGDG